MAPPRILLCGDVFGRLNQLFKRVSTVNKSAGPFDALFCVGQFFPDAPELLEEFTDFVEGRSQVPLPTYFIGDYGVGAIKVLSAASRNHSSLGFKMDGLKICDNLYWLKGSGKFRLHGLSVAYLSGRQSAKGQVHGAYSQDDVDSLRALAEEPGIVDFFLSNEWPSGVTNRVSTDIPQGISDLHGSDSTVAELVAEIKPRYHIAGSKSVFYDRQPYLNMDAVHVTRFIGLAPVGNKDKQKFIHAVSPVPASSMSAFDLSTKTSNTTLSPYTYIEQKFSINESGKRAGDDSDSQYWRYDVSQKRQRSGAGDGDRLCFKFLSSGFCPRGEKCNFRHDDEAREQYRRGVCFDFLNKGKCERGPDCSFKHCLQKEGENHPHSGSNTKTNRSKECWFCLSSPSVEAHLIVSIGETYYCALAKGPLVPDHVLIIPVEHSPNTLLSPVEHETELNKFQTSLKRYHVKQNKEVVFFEWVSKRGTHANLQAVPVPSSRAKSLQSIFNLAADKLGFKFVATKSDEGNSRKVLRAQFDYRQSMFYVELPDGIILSHVVEENETFPAQFGREVVAGLLNVADKADWRNCALSKEEEAKTVEDFKTQFEEFDPNR